jgi:hypothetical protein
MAAKLSEVVEQMKGVLQEPLDPEKRAAKVLEMASEFLVRALARDPERGRIAVLMVVPDRQQLTFAYPEHLARGNVIPMDRESFAGKVVLGKRTLIENNVPEEPHKDFFERIPDPRGSGGAQPIQKMIAAPLLGREGDAIGVVEVSRIGRTAAEAGKDFTATDGQNLEKCCRAFSPFIARVWSPS